LNTKEEIKKKLQALLPGKSAHEIFNARVLPMPPEIPANARISAVLCLLYPVYNELSVLLMKRISDTTAHSGQISFPGGSKDPADSDLISTALRETYEEVGIFENIEILGALTPLYIPVSNFSVHPFVGYCAEKPALHPNKDEVAQIIEVPLISLFKDSGKKITEVISPARPDIVRKANAYVLDDGTVIWGATAMILSELEILIKTN